MNKRKTIAWELTGFIIITISSACRLNTIILSARNPL
jgi:hypothetical protein